MLHRALGAFIDGVIDAARAIPKEDDLVEKLSYDELGDIGK